MSPSSLVTSGLTPALRRRFTTNENKISHLVTALWQDGESLPRSFTMDHCLTVIFITLSRDNHKLWLHNHHSVYLLKRKNLTPSSFCMKTPKIQFLEMLNILYTLYIYIFYFYFFLDEIIFLGKYFSYFFKLAVIITKTYHPPDHCGLLTPATLCFL